VTLSGGRVHAALGIGEKKVLKRYLEVLFLSPKLEISLQMRSNSKELNE
jgi:hypothetical protein